MTVSFEEPLNDLAPERNKLYCRLSINLC